MIVEKKPVKVWKAVARCDCGGEFQYVSDNNNVGDVFLALFSGETPKNLHKCSSCGKEESFEDTYPQIMYEEMLIN